MAEWLRRWIANPLLFERVSSNLTSVDISVFVIFFNKTFFTCLFIVVLPFKRHFRTSLEEMNFSHEDSVPDPRDPNTVGKLRISAFCRSNKMGGLLLLFP